MINKIEQMKKLGDPGRSSGMGDILRDRIVKLAGELQENERENIKLRAELAAERKKREEAEEERSRAESACSYLMDRVEVLRGAINHILKESQSPDDTSNITEYKLKIKFMARIAQRALACLPDRAAAIRKVLDAAKELVSACQEECVEPRFLEETRLFEAVREWRKTWKRQPNSNPR